MQIEKKCSNTDLPWIHIILPVEHAYPVKAATFAPVCAREIITEG